jgi:serine/threonine protein kinase
VAEIGRGRTGVVYRAEHPLIGKRVAIKVLHPRYLDRAAACRRFLHGARALAALRHPGIVDVTDFGTAEDGSIFVVMELLEGRSLKTIVAADGALGTLRAVGIAGQVARALGAAHARGIVHGHVKPRKILVHSQRGGIVVVRAVGDGSLTRMENEGEFDWVKVLGFGAARLHEADRVIGTPRYMAPEQIRGGTIDHRVDIYALGVVLFEMITGLPPFSARTPEETVRLQLESPPPLPSLLRPDLGIPDALERVVLKALAKDRDRRHRLMAELYDDLQKSLQGALARDASRIERGRAKRRTTSVGYAVTESRRPAAPS